MSASAPAVPAASSAFGPESDTGSAPGVTPGDIAVGVVVGRASEYFDFFVFGIASVLVFPAVFFPQLPRLEGTLWSFVIFALAFVVRPLGTLLGMQVQRSTSRGTKLAVAMVMLGTATCGMAMLPDTASAGGAAVALLVLARIVQGLAVGASWDGLPSLLALNAPEHRRGWYAMLGQLGAPIGFALACGLFTLLWRELDAPDFLSWGWRYPFFVAFAINVVALFARLQLIGDDAYLKALRQHELRPCDLDTLLQAQGGNLLIGAFAAIASFALFHIVTVFPMSWIALTSERSLGDVLELQLIGAALAVMGMLASGLLADHIGRRTLLGSLAVAIALFGLAVPSLLDGGLAGQNLFFLLGYVLLGLSYGQAAGAVTSNFQPRLRYMGAALTADLAWLLGAAFAPLVALGLSVRFGLAAVSVYLVSGAVCTLIALRINQTLRD